MLACREVPGFIGIHISKKVLKALSAAMELLTLLQNVAVRLNSFIY